MNIKYKMESEIMFFYYYVLLIHISCNNECEGFRFVIHISHISVDEHLSHIFVLGINLIVVQKKQLTFYHFFQISFLNFTENELGPVQTHLRHSSRAMFSILLLRFRFGSCTVKEISTSTK